MPLKCHDVAMKSFCYVYSMVFYYNSFMLQFLFKRTKENEKKEASIHSQFSIFQYGCRRSELVVDAAAAVESV